MSHECSGHFVLVLRLKSVLCRSVYRHYMGVIMLYQIWEPSECIRC